MQQQIKSFRDLKIWQGACDLTVDIYRITERFPKAEQFGLTSQLRRASISISSNIAEGFGRQTYGNKINFYLIALGSLNEVESLVVVSEKLDFLASKETEILIEKINDLGKSLNSFINKTRSFKTN